MPFPAIAPLKGVLVPLVTPLRPDQSLDADALHRLITHVSAGGIDGLFLLGTTGEGPHLSFNTRKALIQTAAAYAPSHLRCLAGITDCSVDDSLRMADAAAEAGAEAIFFTPPFYFPLAQSEVLRHAEALAKRLPLPYLLYNMPSHARNEYALETVKEISTWSGAAGIKDSSGDWTFFTRLVETFRDRDDFAVFTGPEDVLLDALRIGACGGVAGGGNLAPAWLAGIAAAFRDGRIDEAERLQDKVRKLGQRVYDAAGGPSSYIRGLKCALELAGLCGGTLTSAFVPAGESARESIRAFLLEEGLV